MALADNALTTLATVKEDLNITGTSEDARLERLINTVSDMVENHCDRSFYRVAAEVEKVPGRGWTTLLVNRTPLNSVTSITYNGSAVDADWYEIQDTKAGVIGRTGAWIWTAHHQASITQPALVDTERHLYEITYDGGWYTPKQEDDGAGTRTLPYDLENAVIELVRQSYLAKFINPNVASERLMSWNASYTSGGSGSMNAVVSAAYAILNKYRRIF